MAKKAAKKGARRTTRRLGARRAAGQPPLVKVDFKPLHDALDAAIAKVKARKSSPKRTELLWKLALMRAVKVCPKMGMAAELE